MRTTCVLLALLAPAVAGDWGRTLRELKVEDRQRRRAALRALADGTVTPRGTGETSAGLNRLRRFLSSKVVGVERALAVSALARLGVPAAWERLLAWLPQETDDRVLAAAAEGFRVAPDRIAAQIVRRIDSEKEATARAALLRVLAAVGGEEARKRIRLRARAWDHWCPRAAAVHGLARDTGPGVLALLIELLDESDPAVVTAAAESLTALTRQSHGLDVGKWKAWWAARGLPVTKEKPEPAPPDEERRTVSQPRERRTIAPRYFGIPVLGTKVAFVYDMSASMRYKLPLANDQLVRAIKSLPSTSRFQVVFFNEHVYPWRNRLSWADPITKSRLVDHLADIEIKSYTNLFDSIEHAFSIDPDEVFVISDGAPNRGRFRLPRDIIREVKKLNQKRVPIHTISVVRVVDGDEHIALLATIAQDSGGTHVQRTLK